MAASGRSWLPVGLAELHIVVARVQNGAKGPNMRCAFDRQWNHELQIGEASLRSRCGSGVGCCRGDGGGADVLTRRS